MAELSYVLFWTGTLCVVIGALCYAWFVFGSWRTQAIVQTDAGSVPLTIDQPVSQTTGQIGSGFMLAAIFALGAAIVTRAIAADRPPYGDLWEYFEALAFGTLVVYAVFERRTGDRGAGAVILPAVAVILLGGELLLPHTLEPLVPALRNGRLLAIHVAAMLLAYSALTVAGGAALIVLLNGDGEKKRFERLPSGDAATSLMDQAIMLGFPLLGLGIVLGAYWGNIAWGRYWGWDPKETTALVTWLVYAVYMHVRHLSPWRRRAIFVSLVGYGCLLFNVFAVNFVLAGLHSYAG